MDIISCAKQRVESRKIITGMLFFLIKHIDFNSSFIIRLNLVSCLIKISNMFFFFLFCIQWQVIEDMSIFVFLMVIQAIIFRKYSHTTIDVPLDFLWMC